MKSTLFLFLLLILTQFSFGQCDTNRYVNPIFSTVYKHSDVKYGEAPVWTIPYNNTDLLMDVYEPVGDGLSKRPLMMWAHPGGFILGSKEADDMVALCDSFARRGYVTASISYRLGFNPLSEASAERAVYRGTQDARAAIRYLMEYADIYDIDTNYIFLGGCSIVRETTVHVAYGDQEEAPNSVYGGVIGNDLGCLDCTGNSYVHDIELKGVINMWGALGDSSWIDADETTPALLIHGRDDDVVPFGVGHPFGAFTTPLVHGSRSIHNQLDFHGIAHDTLFFPGQGHEPHGTDNGTFNSPPTPYWDTIFNAVRDHYFAQLQPDSAEILGATAVSALGEAWYSVNIGNTDSACWNVENGTVLQFLRDSALVQWTPGFNNGEVSVRVISEVDAVSSETQLAVTISNSLSLPVVPEFEHSFVIHPNPTDGLLHLTDLPPGSVLSITDKLGREMTRVSAFTSGIVLNVENYPAGVYFVKVLHSGLLIHEHFVKK
ncbi:MAG: T9SS type A sorting domain-containing protein [Crocinitomicaceae bacterium]